jgi:putative ABC transport system permease protein
LFLYGVLTILYNAFYAGVEMAGADRLVVKNRYSVSMLLPYSYKEFIQQIPGVEAVSPFHWFEAVYIEPKNFFVKFAVEDNLLQLYPEYSVPQDQWEAYLLDRQGCIVGRKLAEKFGWQLGDRIPLKDNFSPEPWEFNIRALFDNTKQADDTSVMFFRYDYFRERTQFSRVLWYLVKVANPEHAHQVALAIDERFKNTPDETITETEQLTQSQFVSMLGNIRLILITVGSIVFVTLLLVTCSTMAMAVRERTGEIGVLKTVGFTDGHILLLILAESTLIALCGGAIGLFLAKLYSLGGDPTGGMLRIFYLSPSDIAVGLLIVIVSGVISGIIPGINAMRLRIVDALRRV